MLVLGIIRLVDFVVIKIVRTYSTKPIFNCPTN